MSKEISGRGPWAGGTQHRQQQKGAWVSVLSSSEVILGKTRPEAGFYTKIRSRTWCPSQESHFGLFLPCPCLESFILSSSPSCLTAVSCAGCPVVCGQLSRLPHTSFIPHTCEALLRAHHQNREKEGPQSEAGQKQNTTTTKHDKIPSLVQKGKFVHLKIFFLRHLSIMTERDYSRLVYSPNLWCSSHDSELKRSTSYHIHDNNHF